MRARDIAARVLGLSQALDAVRLMSLTHSAVIGEGNTAKLEKKVQTRGIVAWLCTRHVRLRHVRSRFSACRVLVLCHRVPMLCEGDVSALCEGDVLILCEVEARCCAEPRLGLKILQKHHPQIASASFSS